jgi:prolyl-tRNA synthetase
LGLGESAIRAKEVYEDLTIHGVDVLWDDTNAQAGVQFADADLIGAPLRLIISSRNEKRGVIEYILRDGSKRGEVGAPELMELLRTCIQGMKKAD